MARTPAQIQTWLDEHLHRFDLPAQMLGDEPNARRVPWHPDADSTQVRWLLVASWPYEAAAGNSSIPVVYCAVNDAPVPPGQPGNLADRWYLPATPRDLRLLDRDGIGVFGIETKRPLTDFDVIGSSISYPVLAFSYVKQLTMSGIPARWADRTEHSGQLPMVMVGGQSYAAPEVLAPVVDCWWLGEVEDEPGNPGIAAVCARIQGFKADRRWREDRLGCYADLAREFSFLYFPRFVDTHYHYEDRAHVGVHPHPSKQVCGYTSNLDGLRLPLNRRIVKDLDQAAPLVAPPLLYADPAMGSGDLEVARGCPAWCSFCALCLSGDTLFVTKNGVRRLDDCVGETVEIWNAQRWQKATVDRHGADWLDEITFAPAFRDRRGWVRSRSRFRRVHRATALHRWPLAEGGETHHLAVGDVVRAELVRDSEDFADGWVHGLVFGDGTRENSSLGDRSNCYAVLVRVDQAADYLPRLEALRCGRTHVHQRCGRPVCVISVTQVKPNLYRVRMNARTKLKEFPDSVDFGAGYIGGFIEGWDAADGNQRRRGADQFRINSQHPQALSWLETHAAYGGWALTAVYTRPAGERTNYGQRQHPLREFGLSRVTAWQVVSIEKEVIKDGVYCATVKGDGFFTLASGILTGNTYRQLSRSRTGSGRWTTCSPTPGSSPATWARSGSPRSARTSRCTRRRRS